MKFSNSNALIKSSPWCGLVWLKICFLLATSRLVRLLEVDFKSLETRWTLVGLPAIILVNHFFLPLAIIGHSLSIFPAILPTLFPGGRC